MAKKGRDLLNGSNFETDSGFVKQREEREKIIAKHIENGVVFTDPCTVYIDGNVTIGSGTVIQPNTTIKGETQIGENCEIGPNSVISDSNIENGVLFFCSVADKAYVGKNTNVGPFAYLRPNANIGENVKIGDFVEVKNSNIGNGTKVSHLTYIGDSDVGKNINFGCGTITVNYDGKNKFRTTIEDGAFIGCNTNLVAPVTVKKNSFIAAGSTITEDVEENALAIARSRQTVKKDWKQKRK